MAPVAAAVAAVNKAYGSDRYPDAKLKRSGVVFSVDETTFPGVKKPIKFIVDRRSNVDHDQNFFGRRPHSARRQSFGCLACF